MSTRAPAQKKREDSNTFSSYLPRESFGVDQIPSHLLHIRHTTSENGSSRAYRHDEESSRLRTIVSPLPWIAVHLPICIFVFSLNICHRLLNMINTNLDISSLRRGLESLPQELWAEIYNMVFTEPPGVRDISFRLANGRDFPSPQKKAHLLALKLLQVSRSSRQQYAATYYDAHFISESRFLWETLPSWFQFIPEAHRDLLQQVTMIRPENFGHLALAITPNHYVLRRSIWEICETWSNNGWADRTRKS